MEMESEEQKIANKIGYKKTAKRLIIIGIIFSFIALLAAAGYLVMHDSGIGQWSQLLPTPAPAIITIEISEDKKEVLNAETKEIIFTINEANEYLKSSDYAYDPDAFQNTGAKYAGDCFLDASLSGARNQIVFSSGCLAGDLPQAWIGIYNINWGSDPNTNCASTNCLGVPKFKFLIGGSGKDFVWSVDDKIIIYEADLGLSGFVETRKINAENGEILKQENSHASEFFTSQRGMIRVGGDEYFGYIYLKDNNIYYGGKIRGFIKNDIINIYVNDQILSFKGDLGKLTFGIREEDYNFYYDGYVGLEVSDVFRGPYAIYKEAEMDKIKYKCDGSLLVTSGGKQLPNYYCETNSKDYLSQYEYSAASGNGFATGAEYCESWYKLYIKKINGINYTFNTRLKSDGTCSDQISNPEKYNKDYQDISSKKYLDGILANEENIKNIEEWDRFVENITFIK